MDDMATAHINGKIIAWARRRSGASIDSLATSLLSPGNISAWESGDTFPSESQAIALADRLGIAYPMLFMQIVPPDEKIEVPDLRTVSGNAVVHPSMDFLEVLDDTLARQEWYRNARLDEGVKRLPFVGKFSVKDDPNTVVASMAQELELDTALRATCKNFEEFFRSLVNHAEKSGILVMRSSVVGHSTRRLLKVDEFRGFALVDPTAPIVFVNDNDAKAAQIFTLAHELVHIWIGEGGISDRRPNDKSNSKNTVEIFCDRVAAELLVPAKEFNAYWLSSRNDDHNIREVSQHFRVSTLVVLRRAKDLGRITPATFYAKVDAQYDAYRKKEREKLDKQKQKENKGGNFWASFDLRNSAKFNAAVVDSISRQKTTYTEAAALFGVNLSATVSYLKRVGAK